MRFFNRQEEDTATASMIDRVPTIPRSKPKVTTLALATAAITSIGGLIFGHVAGEISGFFLMADYARKFGEQQPDGTYIFSALREGAIIAMMPVGGLFGALAAGKIADWHGRRAAISAAAFFSCIGTVVEATAESSWVQFAIGNLIDGLGIGALSVAVPMYQSESAPDIIRGFFTGSFPLALAFGLVLAEAINLGTHDISSSASWRIPNGLSFLWALVLAISMLFLPESPRYAYRKGRNHEARITIAQLAGLDPQSYSVKDTMNGLRVSLEHENAAADAKWHEVFIRPRMAYRIILGAVLQAGQQLTGVNFFFYYGTSVFAATGLSDSYVTQLILGAVYFVCTLGGLYVVQYCGRRKALMTGAAWMCMCFLVFSLVGRFALDQDFPMRSKAAGNVLIVFSCLFIAGFALTWGKQMANFHMGLEDAN
jgi:SP family sugar:H+ symporter-like MFS transporter